MDSTTHLHVLSWIVSPNPVSVKETYQEMLIRKMGPLGASQTCEGCCAGGRLEAEKKGLSAEEWEDRTEYCGLRIICAGFAEDCGLRIGDRRMHG